MNFLIDVRLVIPIIWILIQNLLFISIAIFVLRRLGLLKKPWLGLEYSQALTGAVLLLSMVMIANVSIQSIYDTYMNYSRQGTAWYRPLLVKYSQFFLITLVSEMLLLGMVWMISRIYFYSKTDSIASGNLPLAMFMSSVAIGIAVAIGKIESLMLEGMTPHFVVFN